MDEQDLSLTQVFAHLRETHANVKPAPMTPHERAEAIARAWELDDPSEEPGLTAAIAAAIDAHTADLRDLLAQQAARADALEAQVTRYNEMAGKDADELAGLRAENERLREALERICVDYQSAIDRAIKETGGAISSISVRDHFYPPALRKGGK
jgi:hypothetical protein